VKQRARRLVISRSIERKPRAHTGQTSWRGTHRCGPGALLSGEIGNYERWLFVESPMLGGTLSRARSASDRRSEPARSDTDMQKPNPFEINDLSRQGLERVRGSIPL